MHPQRALTPALVPIVPLCRCPPSSRLFASRLHALPLRRHRQSRSTRISPRAFLSRRSSSNLPRDLSNASSPRRTRQRLLQHHRWPRQRGILGEAPRQSSGITHTATRGLRQTSRGPAAGLHSTSSAGPAVQTRAREAGRLAAAAPQPQRSSRVQQRRSSRSSPRAGLVTHVSAVVRARRASNCLRLRDPDQGQSRLLRLSLLGLSMAHSVPTAST